MWKYWFQAAPSMKSILTAIWLMTVAIGNVVVVIVAETGSSMSQVSHCESHCTKLIPSNYFRDFLIYFHCLK